MPHVSSKELDDETIKKVYKMLFDSVSSKNISQKLQRSAFQELFTRTEKVMLGKRLMAISLLTQGASPYRVGKALKLSSTTTAKLLLKLEEGKLSNTEKLCKILRKGPLQQYLENLVKPLPRYGTSPSSLFKEK